MYDLTQGSLINRFQGPSKIEHIASLALNANGSLLATGFDDGTIRLWGTENRMVLRDLVGHTDALTSLEFSPDDTLLASGSRDGTIILWGIEN